MYLIRERVTSLYDNDIVCCNLWPAVGFFQVEMAIAEFPFPATGNSLFRLLKHVVEQPPPLLPKDQGFSPEFQDFVTHW